MVVLDDFAQAVEIIPDKYYFVWVKRPDSVRTSAIAANNITYCIDNELTYEPFFADFGPLNMGRTYRFCKKTQQLLQAVEGTGKKVYLWCGPHAHQKANAAVLVGIFSVLFCAKPADEAYKPLARLQPFVPFRDASCGAPTFNLTVLDVICGIAKAKEVGFVDWASPRSTFSIEEYEYYEQVENGDLNWILPGKLVAFSGPAATRTEYAGYRLPVPEDYWGYYKQTGVTAIVRLNKKVYDRRRFTDGGFRHYDMYFPDGSCPSDAIIAHFLETAEAEPGALAIHCKAGLGRTGVLICCYIMKHYRFTAEEVLGYIRVCRPGSVIGPQQNFIRDMQQKMWHEGDTYRARHQISGVPSLGQDSLKVSGKHVTAAAAPGGVPTAAPVQQRVSRGGAADTAPSRDAHPHHGGMSGADASLTQLAKMQQQQQQQQPMVVVPMQRSPAPSAPSNGQVLSNGLLVPRRSTTPTFNGRRSTTPTNTNSGGSRSTTPGSRRISRGAAPAMNIAPPPPSSSTFSVSASTFSAMRRSFSSGGASDGNASRPASGATTRYGTSSSASPGLAAAASGNPLWATLHTDTVSAAARSKAAIPERTAQSADIGSGWMLGAAGGSLRASTGTPVRGLAPNGQPRKVLAAPSPAAAAVSSSSSSALRSSTGSAYLVSANAAGLLAKGKGAVLTTVTGSGGRLMSSPYSTFTTTR